MTVYNVVWKIVPLVYYSVREEFNLGGVLAKGLCNLRGGGHSLIKVGIDVRALALGVSGVNFCPGIRFWEVNFARALGFWQFLTKNV